MNEHSFNIRDPNNLHNELNDIEEDEELKI